MSRRAETTVKLGILELFARLFGWMWIGAGLIAHFLAAVLNKNKQRVDYVDQLMERGYMPADAAFAWYTATNGGANLLRDLQRLELDDEIYRLESVIGTYSTENPGE